MFTLLCTVRSQLVNVTCLLVGHSWSHWVPWCSLLLSNPYHRTLQAGLLDCILCQHRTDASQSLLVGHQWHVHERESIRKHFFCSSLFFWQCFTYLHLTWMLCQIRGKWLYSCCFAVCCFQHLFKTACSILVLWQYSFISLYFFFFIVVWTQLPLGRNAVAFY